MSIEMSLAPVFVQVALTFVLLFWMGAVRFGSVRRGETRVKDIALGEPSWPPRVQQVSNCFHNQFQLPVLFYVLVVLAHELHRADYVFITLAWLFVILRIVHAAIHTGSNNVRRRFQAFGVGAIVLLAMWVMFALRVLLGLG
jgi:hypothetical protein